MRRIVPSYFPSGENSRSIPVPLGPPLFHLRTGYRIHPILITRVVRATPERPRVLLSLSFLSLPSPFSLPTGIGQIRFSFYNSTKPFGIAISVPLAEEEPQLEIRS